MTLPAPPADEALGLEGRGPTFLLESVVIEGNTVFTDAELEAVLADAIGQRIGSGDHVILRRRLTRVYLHAGYVNSRAILRDQQIADGSVRIEIVEGTLDEIVGSGTERPDPDYVAERLRHAARPPLNVNDPQRRARARRRSCRRAGRRA